MKNIRIVCATPMTREAFWQESPLGKFLAKYHADISIDHSIIYENANGLPHVYNSVMQGHLEDNILLFVHDDVSIEDGFLQEKLNFAIEQFDIVGLAGGSQLKIQSPALWHLATNRETWSGAVAHKFPNGDIAMATYGPTPRRCVVVDGLFVAVDAKKIREKGLWWDPNFTFHHYDLQFCIDANGLGLKIGTWPIWVVHSGLGTSANTPEWQKSENVFLSTNR